MSDVVDLEAHKQSKEPHVNFWALCLKCNRKWIATCHYLTSPFTLECECGAADSFGSIIPVDLETRAMEGLRGKD